MFQAMSYAEMMALNDTQLEQRQVTKGARRKILQSLEKLQERVSLLLQLETCIDEGGDTRCLIYELHTMMSTPMCLQPTPSGLGDGDLPLHIFRVLGRLHRYLFDPTISARSAISSSLRDVQSPEPATLEEDYVAKLLQVYEKCLRHEAFAAWQKDVILGFKRALRRFAKEKGMALAGAVTRLGAGSPNANAFSTRTTYPAGYSSGGSGGGRGGMHANTSSSNHRHQHTLLHKARQPQQKGKLNPSTSTAQPPYNQSSYGGERLTLAPASRFHLLRRHETSPSILTATGQELAAMKISSVPPSPPSTLAPSSASSITNFPASGPMSPPLTINSPPAEFFTRPVQYQPSACLSVCAIEQGKEQQQQKQLHTPPPGFPTTPLNLFATTGGAASHNSMDRSQQSTVACSGGQKNSQINEIMRPYYQQQEIESQTGDALSSSSQEESGGCEKKGGGAVVTLFSAPPTVSQSDARSHWIGGTELGESAKVSSYSTPVWLCTDEEPMGSRLACQRDQFDFAWASQRSAPLNAPSTVRDVSSVVGVPPRTCSPAHLTVYKFVEEDPLVLSNSPSKPFPPKGNACKNTAKNDSSSDPTRFFSPLFVSYAPRTQMQWASIFCDAEGSTGRQQDAKTHLTNSTTANSIWGVGAVH